MENCPIFCAGTDDKEFAKSVQALPKCLDRTHVLQVRCRRKSPGWYGALACNQQICRQALHYFDAHPSAASTRRVYISLEAQARPTLRFSEAALQEVTAKFRESNDLLVHISVLPIPVYGWPRRHLYSKVYEQRSSLCQFSTAMLCSVSDASVWRYFTKSGKQLHSLAQVCEPPVYDALMMRRARH